MAEPKQHRVASGDVELACFEWNPELRGQGPGLLLVHATGFHARCWDPIVARVPKRHTVSVDMRGHGRSTKRPIEHWADLGRDLAALVDALALRDLVGVGHSMGGHSLCDAAALAPGRFSRLVLLDPVIASPDAYGGGWKMLADGELHPTAKRKRHFASAEAMIERFRDREPFTRFTPDSLRAYCVHGLLPSPDGDGFELACPPEIEASVYMTSRTNPGVHDSIAAIEIPALVVRAKLPPPDRSLMDFASSPTWPGLAATFRRGRDLHLAEHSHFLPMEIPDRIAALIEDALGD